jgi:hypothetical protein
MKIFNIKTTNNISGLFDYGRSNQLPASLSAKGAPIVTPNVAAMLWPLVRSR